MNDINGINDSPVQKWKTRVEAHHAQSIGVMDLTQRTEDFWAGYASIFRDDPHRTDDPVLNRLLEFTSAGDSVLDVGGGAGRLAIPMAMRSGSTTVVEPSQSMLRELRFAVTDSGVDNIEIIDSSWEETSVEPHDLVLCSHVVYGIADIEMFVQKLHDHARRRVAIVCFVDSPQAYLAPIWEPVHGDQRVNLPAMPELVSVLWEMGIFPDVNMMPHRRRSTYELTETAMDEIAARLFIGGNPVREERLRAALPEYLEETSDGYAIKGAKPAREGVIHWRTDGQ